MDNQVPKIFQGITARLDEVRKKENTLACPFAPVDVNAYHRIELRRSDTMNQLDRITINPEQCGGRPCVRGMRIRVVDVLQLFAAGLSAEQILDEMPDLEREDLQECLQFAIL